MRWDPSLRSAFLVEASGALLLPWVYCRDSPKGAALHEFDYLSTISGGSYIRSFLTAWVQRRGYVSVLKHLDSYSEPAPESPLPFVRRYSKYLTPRSGLFSADTFSVVALFARNLFLNWLLIIPFLVAFVLFGKIVAAVSWSLPSYEWIVVVLALVAISSIGVAFVDSLRQRPVGNRNLRDALHFSHKNSRGFANHK
jgi:hypothetical protein